MPPDRTCPVVTFVLKQRSDSLDRKAKRHTIKNNIQLHHLFKKRAGTLPMSASFAKREQTSPSGQPF